MCGVDSDTLMTLSKAVTKALASSAKDARLLEGCIR